MKKLFIASLFVFILSLSITPASAARFVTYPMVGVCTGTGVNLRDQPNTKDSEVLSIANKGERLVVLGERKVKGQTWYELENPAPSGFYEGLLWIYGKYLAPAYAERDQRSVGVKMIVDILRKYGTTPEHSIYLLGRDYRESDEERNSVDDNDDRILTWGDGLVKLKYRDNILTAVDISGRTGNDLYDRGFLGIQIGTPVSKVKQLVGGSFNSGMDYCYCNIKNAHGTSEGITIGWRTGGNTVTSLSYYYVQDSD